MSRKLFLSFLIVLLTAQIGFSQTVQTDNKKDELKKQAAEFLRETAIDVGNLRTLENRISFSAEIANLMWYQDEKEARTMFQTVIVDFRQLLIKADTEYTSSAAQSQPGEETYDGGGMFGGEQGSKSTLLRKFMKAVSVRQQIAMSIAEHDPPMAYDFFNSTADAVANAELRQKFAETDVYFEMRLINQIAEADVDKALEAGRKRLAKGASYELIGLQKKIYDKDADKGILFGEEIVSKIKSDDTKDGNFYLLSMILNSGAENLDKLKAKPDKKPMFSEQSLREIADLMAQDIMKRDETQSSLMSGYIPLIERFSPSRGVMLRQKFKLQNTKTAVVTGMGNGIGAGVGNGSGVAIVQQTQENYESPVTREDLYKNTAKLSDKQLPKEEKEKIIAQARQTISKLRSREEKIIMLSLLASQISALGDKESAAEIMKEAAAMVNPQPKNYRDFLGVWMLASGYAQSDPDKAFPLLEDSISRLNETITAFIKVGEFMDVNEEIIEGDEVQVGSFGGEITRGLLGELGSSDSTIKSLAASDFARTKALTNRFDRLEVRILAKMLVLRAVLGDKKVKADE
jgi:hypothetical protein